MARLSRDRKIARLVRQDMIAALDGIAAGERSNGSKSYRRTTFAWTVVDSQPDYQAPID